MVSNSRILKIFNVIFRASLVPVFSFGENDLYNQAENPEGSMLRKMQEKVKSIFGISPPMFYGRGVLNYNFGLIPHRIPINTVGKMPKSYDFFFGRASFWCWLEAMF